MFEFIKRNKIFSGCLLMCITVIVILSGMIFIKNITGNENILVIPPIVDEDKKDPEISLFSGGFNDENDQIHLTWDYQLNEHIFLKVEIYRNDELIKTLYSDRSYDVSIYDYDISTGDNEFELHLYYDNGMVVTKTCEVFVDYVFNIQIDYQLIDNNLGKGYLLVLNYDYNPKTPAGLPNDSITYITTADSTKTYWRWESLRTHNITDLSSGYQHMEVYYLIHLDKFIDQSITWELSFRLDSIGVRIDQIFTDNPANVNPIVENMEIGRN